MKLRPYQTRQVDAILKAFEHYKRVVSCMGTGAGKTASVIAIILWALSQGRKVLFIVDLDSSADDTLLRLQAEGVAAGIIQAGKKYEPGLSVYVCSLQTMTRRKLYPLAGEDVLVILDECHIFAGAQTLTLLHNYPEALHLGLTATPQRGDGTSLGNFYEHLVAGPQLGWLMTHGHCATCDTEGPAGPCCSGERIPYAVRTIYTIAPPGPRPLEGGRIAWCPVSAWFQFAPGRRAIFFCANKRHAEQLTQRFVQAGVPAEAITSDTRGATRKGFRERLRDHRTLVICTHSVGIKALDIPDLACVGIFRRIRVMGVFLQMVGRGARRTAGKDDLVLIDGCGSVWDMGRAEEERELSLDGDPIRISRLRMAALVACAACGAVQNKAEVCCRCGKPLQVQTEQPRISRKNQLAEVREVPLDGRHMSLLEALVLRGLRGVVPAAQRRQEQARAQGRPVGQPVGPWLAVSWAVDEFKKRYAMAPLPDVVAQLKRKHAHDRVHVPVRSPLSSSR